MKMIVLDLEMNQPSGTIIEIGAVRLDTCKSAEEQGLHPLKFGVIDGFHAVCNPGELPSPFIEDLTSITQEAVRSAQPLASVLQAFWAWASQESYHNTIASWGSDCELLIQESLRYKTPGFKHPKILDLQQFVGVYQALLSGNKPKYGLAAQCKIWEIEPVLPWHQALRDATTAARLFHDVAVGVRVFANLRETDD